MLEAMLAGLAAVFRPDTMLFLLLGVVYGNIVGFIPGISGAFALATLLPFTFGMNPGPALALLIGAHSVINTGSSVSAILFGAPGAPGSAATAFDGYPLTKQGQSARAIGAALVASAIGGLIGAGAEGLLIPLVKPLVRTFGPPEIFMLSLAGVAFVASVGEGTFLKGLVAGGIGFCLSLIGQEPSTGALRYTFGQLYLWEGIQLVPVILGLFAVAEMIELSIRGGSISTESSHPQGSMLQGIRDVFIHWSVTLRSSLIGVGIGIMPGMGGEVANFLAYGHVAQTASDKSRFGKGAIEGVIAPEAANNSKEGGDLVPTLAFGVPGSASMAILLGGFLIFGLQPGPSMLIDHLDLVWLTVWTLVIANILGAGMLLAATPLLAKLCLLRSSFLVPVILLVAIVGAYATTNDFGNVIVLLVFGILGYVMKRYGYSRPALVIALVLGDLIEKNYLLSMQIHGPGFLLRPVTLVIAALTVAGMAWPLVTKRLHQSQDTEDG